MKSLTILLLVLMVTACEGDQTVTATEASSDFDDSLMGSFSIRNDEIREEMIAEFEKSGIRYSLSDDGGIGYYLSDGETIDRIGNLIIGEYISRN